MEARTLKTIRTKSKQGHSLSQISELTGLTIDQVKETLGQATGLTPKDVGIIFHMKQQGLGLELISQELRVDLEILKQFLPITETVETHALADQGKGPHQISLGEKAYTLSSPDDCKTYSRSSPTTTDKTKQPPQASKTLPKPQQTFLYSCNDNKMHRGNLLTGEQSCQEVPNYQFKEGCRWSELPGGNLLLTGGGGYPPVREVEKLDTLREYAVSSLPPMHTARQNHAAVYHSQYLYVLGIRECERYSCAETRWEVLPALPVAGWFLSAVEVENSLYALGGQSFPENLDTVQKLSLDSLTWQLMQLKLLHAACNIPCFKTDTQVYLVIKETLYSFTPLQVKPVKTLPRRIECDSSYYSRGTLYYEYGRGIESLALEI
jgi:hypothetical protein